MELININKYYRTKKDTIHILKNVNINFKSGKFYAIMGKSGSGKSTLVNILGLLDNFDSGDYILDGQSVLSLTDREKSKIRNQKIGFVFQSFYLNPKITALENVLLPTMIVIGINFNTKKQNAINLLNKLGLQERINHLPSQLSGGEQQRVAIARALINNPQILIADEPTGNLDSENEKEIFKLLQNISKEGKTVIVVSHNNLIKNYCDELYEINDGTITRKVLWILKK